MPPVNLLSALVTIVGFALAIFASLQIEEERRALRGTVGVIGLALILAGLITL